MPTGLVGPLRLTLFTLLGLAAARDGVIGSPPENAALRQLTQTRKNNDNNINNAQSLHHTPTNRKGKSTDFAKQHHFLPSSRDERAVATLAPAGQSGQAVRAPSSARSAAGTASAGLQTLKARKMQDWEVEDIVLLATIDGSIHARARNSGKELWKFHSDRPMVDVTYARDRFKDYDGMGTEEDIMWIVEPKNGGNIYIFVPGEGGGVQKWDMTVKRLTDEFSPYSDPNMPFVYTAQKSNKLYTLNATDGAPMKYFASGGGGVGIQNRSGCHKKEGLVSDDTDDECELSATIALGRTEYTINIADQMTQETVATIKYFEWTPNTRDADLAGQYMDTLDNKYIYTRFDGSVIALEHDRKGEVRPNPMYSKHFSSSPVVRVFDVVRPREQDLRDPALVLLPQPVAPLVNGDILDNLFINHTESGSFYALSEESYPSVTDGAKNARCYSDIRYLDGFGGLDDDSKKIQSLTRESLIGVHSLNEILERDQHLLTISGPKPEPEPLLIDELDPVMVDETEHPIHLGPSQSFFNSLTKWTDSKVLILVLSLVFYTLAGEHVKAAARKFLPQQSQPISHVQQQVQVEPEVQVALTLNSTEVVEPVAERKVRFAPEIIDEGAETEKEAEESIWKTAEGGDQDQDPDDETLQPTEGQKKKHKRGKRGGRKNKKKGDADEVDKIVDSITTPMQNMQPDAESKNGRVTDVDDSLILRNITVDTSQVLGNGSGGTTVYAGTYEGREVAVKRMLLQYHNLALTEIALLQQSDDHPNVVRYFCNEKDKDFLYIGIERCQTSLWDLFRDGMPLNGTASCQTQLVNDINANMTSSLYQIAAGVRHLHSLRLIHRDIKPQNILIAYPKKNQVNGPRLVISDFGLCRELQDNASTLAATAGNAGTVGWKAPEVIGQPRPGFGTQSSTQNDSNSGSAVGDESVQRGVKRAVDIFSLGCVFFYVLTNGAHPFDSEDGDIGHVEREINIKKWDGPRLDQLSQWGDATEEPRQLIEWMLSKQPENRPTAAQVMNHPFFWSDAKRLNFLCDVSDHFEREIRDPPSHDLSILEDIAYNRKVHRGDFLAQLDKCFIDSLGKQRKYTGDRMLDLLRALRNKKNHYADMDEFTKKRVGDLPSGYLAYWMRRFPGLLMACYDTVRVCGLEGDARFRSYLEEAV